jgi:hypothetical protein
MDVATVLAVVGIVLAIVVPIVVALWVEARKRAHLEIVPSAWHAPNFVAWTFATVRVRNKPLPPRLSRHLSREEAHGCIVEIDYYHWDSGGRSFPTIRGRWSSAPEPLRRVPLSLLAELSPGSSESSSRGQAIVPGTYPAGAAGLPVSGGTARTFQTPRTTGIVGGAGKRRDRKHLPGTRRCRLCRSPGSCRGCGRLRGSAGERRHPEHKRCVRAAWIFDHLRPRKRSEAN